MSTARDTLPVTVPCPEVTETLTLAEPPYVTLGAVMVVVVAAGAETPLTLNTVPPP